MNISTSTRQAYSEIDEFLDLLSPEKRNKIPQKLQGLFKDEKDKNYVKGINPNVPIKDQELKKETLSIIALLNLQYWCDNEAEKERLKKIYADNEKKYQDMLQEKYNPDNIFKNKQSQNLVENTEETSLVPIKEKNFILKLFDKILNIFRKNKN